MNKDVIYIEPEDDITDIINKIESSKEKIIALVPPKKTGVLRSIVNVKLIAKTGNKASKKVVLVTSDPSILKLAAATKIPVTRDLQSAPSIPKMAELEEDDISVEEIIKKADKDGEEEVVAEEVTEKKAAEEEKKDPEKEEKEKEEKAEEPKAKKLPKKASDFKNPVIGWIVDHKKLCIGLGIGLVVLILLMIWAFVIVPAVTVAVEVRTTTGNFSENVTFTEVAEEENASEGKFYLEQKKMENKSEIEFEATGEKNIGEKATGSVVVIVSFDNKGTTSISSGTTFTLSGLTYVANNDVVISWDGSFSSCENEITSIFNLRCKLSKRIDVTAIAPGAKYNIEASSAGWSSSATYLGVYSDQAMSGGTDEMITIVQQSDIDTALAKLETTDEKVNKEKLFDEIPETAFIIESSFRQTMGEAVSTPKVGEEVKDGKKAKLSVVTTSTVYFVDKSKIEEFITEKAKLAENFKIYKINDPFIENFIKTEQGYTGKLKTSYTSGPKITEDDIIEIVKGKGIGTAQHDLMDISGLHKITITPSYPWVSSVPNNPEKITVFIDVPSEQEE